MPKEKVLSDAGREELALALLLWKDFKSQGGMDVDIVRTALGLADHVGVKDEFEKMMSKLPPMKITPR
jgi:hypothetical protein